MGCVKFSRRYGAYREYFGPMAKRVLQATIKVPEIPRVRFFVRKKDAGKADFADITDRVAKLVIEELEDPDGSCALLRLDAAGEVVWKTLHRSLQEVKWHVEFEYGLPQEKWVAV